MDPDPPRRDPVEQLAEEFLSRYRRGEDPSLSEYAAAHPRLAADIRDLFPALVLMEQAGSGRETGESPAAWGPADGRSTPRLGDYRILREIARGGMGVVYEAEQAALGRHVALKVLPAPEARDPVRLERFRREARVAARLHHTNIVPVFDVGEDRGLFYYSMQFIRGQTLAQVLDELRRLQGANRPGGTPGSPTGGAGPSASLGRGLLTTEGAANCRLAETLPGFDLAPTEAGQVATPGGDKGRAGGSSLTALSGPDYYRNVARIGLQVAEALAYAHHHRVLHRDIKPANLLLDLEGRAWVTDFGLAKDEGDDLTCPGDVVGTLRYMAPERFEGEADPRSDVYSLGLTLYELATLHPAFGETDRARLVRQITQQEPRPPRSVDRRVPRDLETIIQTACARESCRRYDSAGSMADDLRRFLADRAPRARRPSPAGRAWRWCRRNPALAASLVISALLLAGGLAGSTAAAYRFQRLARSENAARGDADRRADDAREVVDFLVNDMLASAAPDRTLGRAVTIDEVLHRAGAAIEGRFTGQPLVEASIRQALGLAFRKLGEYPQAETELTRAIALRRDRLGPEHPDTLTAMSDLATTYTESGQHGRAIPIVERVLAARLRVLGADHPDTLTSMNDRAVILRDSGRWDESRVLFRRVIAARSRVRGREHPDTLTSLSNLALQLRWEGGRDDEVGALMSRVIDARRRRLGPDHPRTLDAVDNLAHLLRDHDRLHEARGLYEDVLARRRRVLRDHHPETLTSEVNLARVLAALGRWEEAAALYDAALGEGRGLVDARYERALIRLRQGDRAGFRRDATRLLRDHGRTTNLHHAGLVVRLGTLTPGAVDDLPTLDALTLRGVTPDAGHPWLLLLRGAATYRAGRWEEAAHWLERCQAFRPSVGVGDRFWVDDYAALFLALAYKRLGRDADAGRSLAEARRHESEYQERVRRRDGRPGAEWPYAVGARAVLDEVEALVAQGAETLPDEVFAP